VRGRVDSEPDAGDFMPREKPIFPIEPFDDAGEVIEKWLRVSSGRTTEVYAHLADKYLQTVVNQLPSPDLGTSLGTTVVLPGPGIVQVAEKKRT
jgi:hypothetical protein